MRTALFLLLACVSFCQAAESSTQCSVNDRKAIDAAIKQYLDKNTGIASAEVIFSQEKCIKSYASAKITPKKPLTDTATVFLHQVRNQWQVMTLGTDFDKQFLLKIPKELQPY